MLVLVAGSLLTFGSCVKSGDRGPQGPTGPTGNANVIGVGKQFTVSAWALTGTTWSADFADQDITSDIVNNGVVEMYKQYTSGWTNLPDINNGQSTVFDFYTGGFTIYIQNLDGTSSANPGSIIFRDVIISASQKQAHPHTNWSNYNETVATLGIAPTVTQAITPLSN